MFKHLSPKLGKRSKLLGWVITSLIIASCTDTTYSQTPHSKSNDTPVYSYEVVNEYPHNLSAFTQGLLFKDGYFYESTGLHGHSTVRRVVPETGEVEKFARIDKKFYAEGLTTRGDDLILLTWKAETGFVIDPSTLKTISTFKYKGDGWGLTSSDENIFMSDGTSFIRVLDPATLEEESRFQVTEKGKPVKKINELEWVEGEIYANIWKTDKIAKIDPETGNVTAWIDMSGLFKKRNPKFQGEDVLNGIAYDKNTKRLFVTGKLWPSLFEIKEVKVR